MCRVWAAKYSEVVLSLPNPVMEEGDGRARVRYDLRPTNVVRIHYQGANDEPEVAAMGELPGVANILKGNNRSKWLTDLPTYSGVAYRELYPGIELRYEGTNGELKSTFYVAPGADPSVITWRYKGAEAVNIDNSGNLVVSLPEPSENGAVLTESAPIAWQEVNGTRILVSVRYVLSGNDKKVSFLFPDGYDPTLPLVIDPTLTYSTYLGGGKSDEGSAITLDADCNVYLVGETNSTNFPTVNAYQGNLPSSDVFVSKLNPEGNTLLYSTYIGGDQADHGWGIALDSQGRITLVGETESSNFPTLNAYDTSYGGGACGSGLCDDAFVTQLSADGSALRYSTYLGEANHDAAYGMAIGPNDQIYLTGVTKSSGFPVTASAYDGSFGGGTCNNAPCEDGFVIQVDPALSGTASLKYSSFLGGLKHDAGMGIAIDASGQVYVAGYADSSDFPLRNAYQSVPGGSYDAFVSKFDMALSGDASLLYSTFLGGSATDKATGIAVKSPNEVYITGYTHSTNFPTANAFQNTFSGGNCGTLICYDAFVSHLNIASNTLVYSSYLGGDHEDKGLGITVDDSGNAYLTGYTKSGNFPTVAPIQATKGSDSCSKPPCPDAFIVKVNAAGSAMVYSTYLGGGQEDFGNAIVLDGLGNTYIVGHTFSSTFPGAINPFTGTSGYADAFVVKIEE